MAGWKPATGGADERAGRLRLAGEGVFPAFLGNRMPTAARGTLQSILSMAERVSLFVTCIVDQLFPQIGMAMAEVLERLGYELDFPEKQTCRSEEHTSELQSR